MRNVKLMLGLMVVLGYSGFALGQMAMTAAKTPGDALNAILDIGSGEFIGAADAMAEDKYSLPPPAASLRVCERSVSRLSMSPQSTTFSAATV